MLSLSDDKLTSILAFKVSRMTAIVGGLTGIKGPNGGVKWRWGTPHSHAIRVKKNLMPLSLQL